MSVRCGSRACVRLLLVFVTEGSAAVKCRTAALYILPNIIQLSHQSQKSSRIKSSNAA